MPNINAHNTIHFIVNLFKVYNDSCFKRNLSVSPLFLSICIIKYANYKSSQHIQVFDDLWSGVKLRTLNITKILFCKHMNNSCEAKVEAQQSL